MKSSNWTEKNRYIGKILIWCFFAALVFLVVQTVASETDVNDTWILEGVVPSFFLFTVIYVINVSISSDLKIIAILTSIYLGILNLIPLLKYSFIYGYFDPLPHYGFIQDLITAGHVPTSGTYAIQYGTTPGSHLIISQLSIVTGVGPLVSMKVFLLVSPFLIPLALYFVLKRLEISIDLSKIIIVASIITMPVMYRFVGTVGAYALYSLFTYSWVLFVCGRLSSQESFISILLFGTAVVVSHDVTTFFMIAFLVAVSILLWIRKPSEGQLVSSRRLLSFTGAFVTIAIAHLALFSTANLATILNLLKELFLSLLGGRTPGAISYYGGFYALTPLQQILVFAVRFGRDGISLILVILAPLALLMLKLMDKRLKAFYYVIAVPAIVSFAAFVLAFFIRSGIVNRGLIYLSIFAPFFAGITLYWLVYSRHFRFQKLVFGTVLLFLFCLSILQLYPTQPLVPRILTDSGSYYVMDQRALTTVYDFSVISFVSSHDSQTTLATDSTFRSQIYALTNVSFQTLMTSENPGSGPIKAGLILVSFDGDTHILVSGRDAVQYAQYVDSALQNYSVVYSNSKSFVLLNSPNP